MKVLIVGAGIGGLALTGFLKDSGIECEVIEKAGEQDAEGFLFGLWSNAGLMLEKLGCGNVFTDGSPMRTLRIETKDDTVLRSVDLYSALPGEMPMVAVSRADLHARLESVAGGKVQRGREIISLSQGNGRSQVVFSDGSAGTYDLVVGADGMRSSVRELMSGSASRRSRGWRAWYFWVGEEVEPGTIVETLAPGKFMVLFAANGRGLATVIASVPSAVPDVPPERLDLLSRIFADVPSVLRILPGDPSAISVTDLTEVRARSWSQGSITLLGDAAHGMYPLGSLGASLALEDAYVLADELKKAPAGRPIAHTLYAYERRRASRVRLARRLTRKLERIVLVRSGIFRAALNSILKLIPRSFITRGYRKLLANAP